MQKRTVRLGQGALRRLFSEAIQSRQPGSPLFSAPSVRLREGSTYEATYSEASEAIREYFMGLYDASDPVMAEYGKESWDSQVSYAMHQVDGELSDLIERIQDSLENGEFALHASPR